MLADLYNIYQLKPSSVMEMCIKFTTNWIQHSVSRYGVLIYCILIPAILLLPFISVLACQLKPVKKLLTFLYLFYSLVLQENIFYQLHPNLSKNRKLKSNMTERNDSTCMTVWSHRQENRAVRSDAPDTFQWAQRVSDSHLLSQKC